jgi:hypothetical protein
LVRAAATAKRDESRPDVRLRNGSHRWEAWRVGRRTYVAAFLTAGTILGFATPAHAYVDCGDPAGPARNVTATKVGCGDARAFARKVAKQGVTTSQAITLPGWRTYSARVRRKGDEYDVRATRGSKVIRFQYRSGSSPGGGICDPNYSGCLDPTAYDYDCLGGSGDGPEYTGLVRVLGDDRFDLDRDGDGIACDI